MNQQQPNSVATQSENFDLAQQALSQAKSVLNNAIGAVRDKVYVSGRVDEALLHNAQQDCYDLAMLSADVWSAQCLVEFAETQSRSSLVCQLTWKFVAEKVRGVMAAQFAGASTLERSRETFESLAARPALQQFLDEHGARDSYADLGRLLSETEVNELPSGLTEEKALIADTFRRFADEVVAPLAGVIHREDRDIPDEIIQSAARMGCFGTCIPERFGGLQPDEQPDSLGMIVVTEELSRGSLGAAGSLITRPEIAARALLAGGTESQKSGWLPQLAAGEKLCAISITEPNTGSDVAAVSLRATPTEGGWLLNGAKTWCTFAGKSEVLVVLGRTNPDASSGYRGLSLFLVEKPAYSGHEFTFSPSGGGSLSGKAISTLGYRGMHSYDLFFEDFFVPAENLIGEAKGEGKGFYYTMAGFSGGRIQTAARANGVMQAAYEQALRYANEREVFGAPIAALQITRIKLARMLATITASRQFSYSVARMMDQGEGQMEASLVKLFACRAAEWVTREAMQIHGGMGYAEETAVSRYFVDARVLSIFEGTEEVLATRVVARELLERGGL